MNYLKPTEQEKKKLDYMRLSDKHPNCLCELTPMSDLPYYIRTTRPNALKRLWGRVVKWLVSL